MSQNDFTDGLLRKKDTLVSFQVKKLFKNIIKLS